MTNLWFSAAQAATAQAIFERMFPTDVAGPGATEIGVLHFVERALVGHDQRLQDAYRNGLSMIRAAAIERFSQDFPACTAEQQDELIAALEDGELLPVDARRQKAFFAVLMLHLRQGLFSDPVHGGNNDYLGWRYLGHPGVWLDYTEEESLSPEPANKNGRTIGLADLPPAETVVAKPSIPDPGFDDDDELDAIVVGVGLVGGMILPRLASAGLKVLALEAGPWRQSGEFKPDELTYGFAQRGHFGEKFGKEWPLWRPNGQTEAVPAGHSLGHMVNGVGGSALHYAAMLRRYHPHHFHEATRYASLGGEHVLPQGSTLADWPLRYEDLEPYYEEMEALAGVSGGEGNPFVPRRKPNPLPAMQRYRLGDRFKDVAEELGYHPYMCPVGINSQPYNGRPGTRYNTFELTLGDNVDSKWHPGLDCVPEALETGNVELQVSARVTRVLTDAQGQANGVEYVDSNGRTHRRRARAVILTAFTLENIRLMYMSADEHHPEGLGNNSDQLGRHAMFRMFCSVYGEVPGENFNLHTGAVMQNMMFEDFESETFNSLEHGFVGGATLGTEQGALPIAISRAPLPKGMRGWGSEFKEHLRGWQSYAFVRIQHDAMPYADHRIELDPVHRDRSGLGLPVLRITHELEPNELRQQDFMVEKAAELLKGMGATRTWEGPSYTGVLSSHELGGCRAGEDPGRSVVSPSLEVHDTPGLYVMGGAVFPTSPGVNPTLTMMALAAKSTDALASKLIGARDKAMAGSTQ